MADPIVEPDAVQLVLDFEQSGTFSPRPYLDPAGIPTIGYGSIWDWRTVPSSRVTMDTPELDEAMARWFMTMELRIALLSIKHSIKVPLTHGETAALEDFIYNEGVGRLESSTLLKKLNAGDYEGAANELPKWDLSKGKVLAGLVRRRAADFAEWHKADSPTPTLMETT